VCGVLVGGLSAISLSRDSPKALEQRCDGEADDELCATAVQAGGQDTFKKYGARCTRLLNGVRGMAGLKPLRWWR
jgi:hypothetical protein